MNYFHKEGRSLVLLLLVLFGAIDFVIYYFTCKYPVIFILSSLTFLVLWYLVAQFFRNPSRPVSAPENAVIAPADGKVVVIEETFEPEYFKDKRIQVSIFMSPLNVHVNRNPIDGTVQYAKYHKGLYLVAWHPKSSTENERTTIVFKNDKVELLVRQIAGAVARRIRFYVKQGDAVKRGEDFGFIKFGSRVDVFFPLGTKIDVEIGQIVKGNTTILAKV